MSISIHQITCGERDKSWQLLNSTLPDSDIARKIAFQCDLQDSPPSGIQWSPSIRGFAYGEWYLVMKTYLDPSPGMRNGRAFSHCLVICKQDLILLRDISSLFGFFETGVNKEKELTVIRLAENEDVACRNVLQIEARFNKVIQGFVKGETYKAIIWVNYSGFETATCEFWKLLSHDQRQQFSFGMNFNPSAISEDRINFITVPESLVNKFENKNYLIVGKYDAATLTEFGEKFIAGHPDAIFKLDSFLSAMEAGSVKRSDLGIIAKGLPAFEELDKLEDVKKITNLANIIAKFSPNAAKGILLKESLCQRMAIAVNKASLSDIMVLKVFPIEVFNIGVAKISKSIDLWLKNNLPKHIELLVLGLEKKNENWLSKRINENISSFLDNISDKQVPIVFDWMEKNDKVVPLLFQKILLSIKDEQFYVDNYSILKNQHALNALKKASIVSGWFALLATILKNEYAPAEAIEELIKHDKDPMSMKGIHILQEEITVPEIIKLAIKTSDERIIDLVVRSIPSNYGVFDSINIKKINVQKLWLASAKANGLTSGFSNPEQAVFSFLDHLADGNPYEPELLKIIAAGEYADVLHFPRRIELWSSLTDDIRNKFLGETSASLLEQLSSNSSVEIPEDPLLYKYIMNTAIGTFLYYNRDNIKSVLPIFQKITQMPEWYLRDFIVNYESKIDVVDATQLGELASTMSSPDCAYAVFRKAPINKSFKPALKLCYHRLEFLDRGLVAAWGWVSHMEISENEWWEAFIPLCHKLFPQGPMQNGLWTAADGDESILLHNATGRDIWNDALRQLRYGGTEDLTVSKLIKQMQKKFSKNEELKTIKYLWKNMNQE